MNKPAKVQQFDSSRFVMAGEKIYEFDLSIISMTDYGVKMDDILAGKVAVPAQGARFDVYFEGHSSGRISGSVRGVDYLCLRADGRFDLDIHSTIETSDGCRIAMYADGVASPGKPHINLAENISLTTAANAWDWVNTRQVWGTGTVNLALGKIRIEAYLQ